MISIVIPVKSAGQEVRDLLAKLRTQTVQSEIIVFDSSASGEASGTAGSFDARVVTVRSGEFDHGGTRALAAGEARGDILIFLTQDALPFDERSVENLVRPFGDETVGAAYGRQVPYPDASPIAAHLRLFNYPATSCLRSLGDREKFGIRTPFISNAFSAYRKKTLLLVGGFKERLIMGEDVYAGAKLLLAGYKIAYTADAAVYHSHNYTAFQELKRYFDIGVFHRSEEWILEEFGRAEGEGMRYVRSGISFLIKNGKYHLLPEFMLRNCMKYAGYFMGRNYERLPSGLTRLLSMHSQWWR
jgi:rhamnosyltransferase